KPMDQNQFPGIDKTDQQGEQPQESQGKGKGSNPANGIGEQPTEKPPNGPSQKIYGVDIGPYRNDRGFLQGRVQQGVQYRWQVNGHQGGNLARKDIAQKAHRKKKPATYKGRITAGTV